MDRPQAVFVPGDRITGTVRLRADGDATLRSVRVRCEWRTSGKGTTDKGRKGESVLATELTLRADEARACRFDLPAPDGPPTYSGHLLEVNWRLRAEADVPRGRDAKAEVEFVLAPPQSDREARRTPEPYLRGMPAAELAPGALDRLEAVGEPDPTFGQRKVHLPRPVQILLVGCLAVLFLVPLLAFVLTGVVGLLTGSPAGMGGMAFALVFLAAGGVGGVLLLRNVVAERRLGTAELKVLSQSVRVGEPVQFFVRFVPTRNLRLQSVRATLTAQESATSGGSEKSRSTRRHTITELEASATAPHTIGHGEDTVFVGRIDLPTGGPSSFRSPSNRIEWRLDVRVTLPGWPDWKRVVPVEVRP